MKIFKLKSILVPLFFMVVFSLTSCDTTGKDEAQNNEDATNEHSDSSNINNQSAHDMNNSKMMSVMHDMHTEMTNIKMTGDPDHDFAAMMVPHHQGAIDMANAELSDGKNEEARQMAKEIISKQEKEISDLNEWLSKHKPGPVNDKFQEEMKSSMQMDMSKMEVSGDTDKDFLTMMIPHHQSAIDMAKIQLKYGNDVQMNKMAQQVVADQEKEIATIRQMLSKL